MGLLLVCVGALGVTTQASAQTVNSRPGASQFLHDGLTRETVQQLYDEPKVQHPVGFEPQDRRGEPFSPLGSGGAQCWW